VDPVEGRVITETLDQLMDDLDVAAVKIGMLGSEEAAKAVAAFLKRYSLRFVVLDPIIRSSSGAELISRDGLQILKDRILPRAYVTTPNLDEAAALTDLTVTTKDEMERAALRLHKMGAGNVIVTGGHLDPPNDLLSQRGKAVTLLKGHMVSGHSTHGTGCAFSTALACNLAMGKNLVTAAKAAKRFVETALSKAPAIGKGIGPIV
jgi:hydroxymethylpyrimidine/phosphomethylpyrimidine kinase